MAVQSLVTEASSCSSITNISITKDSERMLENGLLTDWDRGGFIGFYIFTDRTNSGIRWRRFAPTATRLSISGAYPKFDF